MLTRAQYGHWFFTSLFLFSCLEMVSVRGSLKSIQLGPSDLKVNVGEWAIYSCNMSCNLTLTNTMYWFVGDSPNSGRRVDDGFEQRTGIMIKEEEITGCGGSEEMLRKKLYIFASSVDKMNKTAVQCAATRKHPSVPDLFSHYSLMFVEEPPTTPQTTEPEVTTGNGFPEPSTTAPEVTKTVTVTVTQTVQVTTIPQPNSAQSRVCPSNGNSREASSLILTLFLTTLSVFVLLLTN